MPPIVAAILVAAAAGRPQPILSYRPILALSPSSPGKVFLRRFTRGGRDSVLAIAPDALATTLEPAPPDLREVGWPEIRSVHASSPWIRAIDRVRGSEGVLQDAGIRHSERPEDGVDLTIDLCPSRKPLDRGFFRDLLAALEDEQKPVPIGFSVSGRWMAAHGDDLAWLRTLEAAGRIRPVWIDHTWRHRASPDASLSRNFLLEPGTDLREEVFRTEKAMIDRGMVPSPFFRFPGLVSRDTLVERILSWGLVPVGCDAWLAKNQRARRGSIVLVHANGNEPLGLMRFRVLLREHRDEIRAHRWLLYDLRESLSEP